MRSDNPRRDHHRKTPVKRPYRAPRLILHGTVRDLTQSGGAINTPDAGSQFSVSSP